MPALSGSRVGRDMQLTEATKQVELPLDSLSQDSEVLEVSVVKKDSVWSMWQALGFRTKLYLQQETVMCLLKNRS